MVYFTMLSETRQSVIEHVFIGETVGSDGEVGENSNPMSTPLINKCKQFVNIWLKMSKLNHNARNGKRKIQILWDVTTC
jgi:hypothetical protein